jgi:basic membrane lipoprotein Med (substrate-binding protein (PBP1-ABC) superfamily)
MKVEDFSSAFDGNQDSYQEILKSFRAIATVLVDDGADVVIPAGNLFGLLTANEVDFKVSNAPVIPCTSITLQAAEQAIKLHKSAGLAPIREPRFTKAGKVSIDDFLQMLSILSKYFFKDLSYLFFNIF